MAVHQVRLGTSVSLDKGAPAHARTDDQECAYRISLRNFFQSEELTENRTSVAIWKRPRMSRIQEVHEGEWDAHAAPRPRNGMTLVTSAPEACIHARAFEIGRAHV